MDGKAYNGDYLEGTVVSYGETLPGENTNGAYQLYPVTLDALCTVNFKYTVNNHVVLAASKRSFLTQPLQQTTILVLQSQAIIRMLLLKVVML